MISIRYLLSSGTRWSNTCAIIWDFDTGTGMTIKILYIGLVLIKRCQPLQPVRDFRCAERKARFVCSSHFSSSYWSMLHFDYAQGCIRMHLISIVTTMFINKFTGKIHSFGIQTIT